MMGGGSVVRLPDVVGGRLDWVAVVMALVGGWMAWHGKGGVWSVGNSGWLVALRCVALACQTFGLWLWLSTSWGRQGGQAGSLDGRWCLWVA